MLTAEVKQHGGIPTLHINETPVNGIMHWNRWPEAVDLENFHQAGINILSFMGNVWLGEEHSNYSEELQKVLDGRMPCNTLSPAEIDRIMEKLVKANPDILVMPRIRLIPPEWWKQKYQDELMLHYDLDSGEYIKGEWPAISSKNWIEQSFDGLARVVQYFEENWGEYVMGYHVGGGDCIEHSYQWGFPKRVLSDYSSSQVNAFRDWLKKRYKDNDELKLAWKNDDITFDGVEIPAPDRRIRSRYGNSLCNPENEMELIDYHTFHSDIMAEFVIKQARAVKTILENMGRNKIFATFYTYHNFPTNEQQVHYNAGHDSHERVLNSDDIDMICCPIGYAVRQSGGYSTEQVPTGSVSLHGKLYYAEDDTGTHLTEHHHGYMAPDADTAIQIHRRNFLSAFSSKGTLWWMDLQGKGWFRDKRLLENFSLLKSFADEHLATRQSVAEIAVFISDTSMRYIKYDSTCSIAGTLAERQRQEICSIGASYDLYRVEDIELMAEQNMLRQYKFCIFIDAIEVSDRIRKCIKEKLACNNRSLLWLYIPGLMQNGKRNIDNIKELTGFNLELVENTGRSALIAETWLDDTRYTYGADRNIFPRLAGNDSEADELGYYVEGTGMIAHGSRRGDSPSMLSKQFGSYRSIWSGVPGVPGNILRKFAEDAGVHIYCQRGDQVFAGPSWLGVHAKLNGKINIKTKEQSDYIDVFTGEKIMSSENSFIELQMQRGETKLLQIMSH